MNCFALPLHVTWKAWVIQTSWWPGIALVDVAVNLRATGLSSMYFEELLMTVRWGCIHYFDLLFLFLELSQLVFCTTQGAQGRAVLSFSYPWTTWGSSSSSPVPWSVHLDFFWLLWWQVLVLLCRRYFQFMLLSGMIVNWGMLPLSSFCRCLSSVCINTSAALCFKKRKVCISWNCWHLGVVTNVSSLHPKYMNQIFGYNFPTLITIDTFWFESLV